MRILIVDDSVVYRHFIRDALASIPGVEIVGVAANGRIALQKLEQQGVDLVTLDLEMPELDGLGTLKEMRQRKLKVPVIVFASETTSSAHQAFDAIRLGALDFLAKPKGHDDGDVAAKVRAQLTAKIQQMIAASNQLSTMAGKSFESEQREVLPSNPLPRFQVPRPTSSADVVSLQAFRPQVVVIGSSTGGPHALEILLKHLVLPLRCPVFITQHMPPFFTTTFAERLGKVTGLPCYEAKQGQVADAGSLYVAPGNYHMTFVRQEKKIVIQLDQGPLINSVRPAVDPLFESAARCFGASVMGVVMTGMGEDGARGAAVIKAAGGKIAIQNEASCVVFGMPGAVFQQNLHDLAATPDELGDLLNRQLKH